MNDEPARDDPDEGLSHSDEQEIGRLCVAFEQRWRDGEHPRIEEQLQCVRNSLRATLLQRLVTWEVAARRGKGEDVSIDEYRRRFPDLRQVLDRAGTQLDEVESPIEPNTIHVSSDLERSKANSSGDANASDN